MATGRERLAELRAAKGTTSPRSTQYEMQTVQPGAPHSATNGADSFYDEVGSLRDSLKALDQSINRVNDLHNRSLTSTDQSGAQATAAEIKNYTAETRASVNGIKQRIQALQDNQKRSDPDSKAKRDQINTIKTQFKDCISRFQRVELDSQSRYRQRMERQFKIVKPDATEEELRQVVRGDQPDQIFAQALMDSNRYGESRAAYREVQTRHEEIQNIERTLEELAQLFNDMALLVEKDEDNLNMVHDLAVNIDDDTRQGLDHTEEAVKKARSARKKKIWCFWISVIIVCAVLGIVLGITIPKKK